MHREVLRLGSYIENPVQVDHENRNTLDNQKHNLRTCSNAQNQQNIPSKSHTKFKYKGIKLSKNKKRWEARITVNKKQIHLGTFDTDVEAAKIYDSHAMQFFGEFAFLNFPK